MSGALSRAWRLAAAVLPLGATVAACELTEVTVAPGKRVVVVQSVISRTDPIQFVVVEYSQTGESPAAPGAGSLASGPRSPISGAAVTIAHRGPGPCAGHLDTLLERASRDPARGGAGIYAGPICPPEPGDLLALRVETPAGDLVTGTTLVPGAAKRETLAGTWSSGAAYWVFNRRHDTLKVHLAPRSGVALQIEVRNREDPDQLALFALADTMDLRFPGNLVNPFQGDHGASVFRAGRYYALGVALADRNYYDFVRSRSDPFTGRGFINHLNGGIGVFGSVETERAILRVVAPLSDPREGRYRLTGSLDGVSVDVLLEVYLDELEAGSFSAFASGQWREGPIDTHGDGFFPQGGTASPMTFQLGIPLPGDSLGRTSFYFMSGDRREAGAAFPVVVRSLIPGRGQPRVDTLTAQQISGPGLASGARREGLASELTAQQVSAPRLGGTGGRQRRGSLVGLKFPTY